MNTTSMLIKDADGANVGTETMERWGMPRFLLCWNNWEARMAETGEERLIKLQGQTSALLP